MTTIQDDFFNVTPLLGQPTRATWSDAVVTLLSPLDTSAAETTAGVTPTNYEYPVGDVRRYGAVGDGITDDTAAIEAAIDVAAISGGVVFGTKGQTYLCLNVELPTGVVFDGRGSSLRAAVAGAAAFVIGCEAAATDVSIVNCVINGDNASQVELVDGIKVRGSRILVAGNDIYDTSASGISIDAGSSYLTINRNTVRNPDRNGIIFEYSAADVTSYFSVVDNKIQDTGAAGVTFIAGDGATPCAGVTHGRVAGNIVENTGLDEVAGGIGGYSPNNSHLLIEGNIVENPGNHAHHLGGDHITIRGNTCRGALNAAIVVRNWPNDGGGVGAPVGDHAVIQGNIIESTETYDNGEGITVQNYTNVNISNNNIDGTLGTGIRVAGNVLGTSVRCTDIVISANNVANVGYASDHSDSEYGISVSFTDRCVVSGNSVRDTYDAGIHATNVTDVAISGNVSSSSDNAAGILIILGTTLTQVTVTGNVCNNNTGHGIQLSGAVDRILIANNIVRSNTAGSITLSTATNVTLHGNLGYRTKNRGTASVADGGTISHFIDGTPTMYKLTPTVAGRIAAVTAASSSTITVSLTDHAGTPIAVAEGVNWEVTTELS